MGCSKFKYVIVYNDGESEIKKCFADEISEMLYNLDNHSQSDIVSIARIGLVW